MKKVLRLEFEDVKLILRGSEDEARKIGVDMDIAVAIDKAFTAAGTRRPTREYKAVGAPNGPAFGINTSNQGRFMIFGGGVPIIVDGECIGAVGCSSGSPEQDEQVAQAGIDALL